MAITNYERVGKSLELLREGLLPFVSRELEAKLGKYWVTAVTESWQNELVWKDNEEMPQLDAAALLRMMWDRWNEVFKLTLGFSERSLVSELREVRNKWAHQNPFSGDDAYRALDSAARLLTAISAPQAEEVERMKMELLRVRFEEQTRGEKRKAGGSLIEGISAANALRPWREVVSPHPDVASGQYQQAEFAADLWQVHLGEGSKEYRDPKEFFRRTFLTESLKRLLTGAARRLSGTGGDPVVQLQTNFGGGKTHSMLALYHLFSGVKPADLAGIDTLLAQAETNALPSVRRVVLVGNKISPGNPVVKADGTVVRTLWGELAWQLGGKKAFETVQADDERATNPGDVLRELFNEYGPCLILIDEWVAYARQLHDRNDLPGGDFETQFTFAQALTESARLAERCLLVISLPASDVQAGVQPRGEDVEVGGLRGREALDRLGHVIGRVESAWHPATAEEGFEIVRRRLFEPLGDAEAYKARDVTARAFSDLYNSQKGEFPPESRSADYERRIQVAYPIHPEIFDQLYGGWSTLVKFQRTRGVLRLMAAVIHSLWEKGDRNPIILPSMIPIDDAQVQSELTRYLPENWMPVIEKDVDGSNSLPVKLDGELSNLGKYSASRRVARTIYLGSAPTGAAAHRGIEDRQVKLGCVLPGESPAVFGDALRRLAAAATYLYQDGSRYWYSTQPTVTRLADDRAEQIRRNPDSIFEELEKRLRPNNSSTGDFARVHSLPSSSADVPDDTSARLVILSPQQPYSKEAGNLAETAAKEILEFRGTTPRLYRNTLLFLAADKTRYSDLEDALSKYLAWSSIVRDKIELNLDAHQTKQAQNQMDTANGIVNARLPETYTWILVPVQQTPQSPVVWESLKLSGNDQLAPRAAKKLRSEDLLIPALGATILRKDMDRIPLWRGNHVSVRQLADDFARYVYLPRLTSPDVLAKAITSGVSLITWRQDSFAMAESYDESAKRYRGLQTGAVEYVMPNSANLLVRPAVAFEQMRAEAEEISPHESGGKGISNANKDANEKHKVPEAASLIQTERPRLRRFYGSVELDPARVGRDAGRIADEVITHLNSIIGANIKITLEIQADMPGGATEQVVRTVQENGRTLKFITCEFEQD